MAEKNHFLPEDRYIPSYLPCWDYSPNYYIGKIVHVLPKEYIQQNNQLIVRGENFTGTIETEELSIYPIVFFEESHIPRFLPHLFGQCITAIITGFSDNHFILSRKETMKQALSYIKIGDVVEAKINNITPKITFLDIGAGLSAIIPLSETSASYVGDARSFFIDFDYITVKIIRESQFHEDKFIASYRLAYTPKPISKGDIVIGKAVNYLEDHTGIFVEISPNQVGVLDTDNLVVAASEIDESLNPDIVLGITYSFFVQRTRGVHNGIFHYSLRLIKS